MGPSFDFTPLFRSSIGFDRMLKALETASRLDTVEAWPPYDIVRVGKDEYRITMAVPGFSPDEMTLTHEPNMLVVAGQKANEDSGQYLHRGMAQRAFQRRFELADHVKVTGARLVDGLLTIDLVREIPEEMKPRRIEIASAPALLGTDSQQNEAGKQVA